MKDIFSRIVGAFLQVVLSALILAFPCMIFTTMISVLFGVVINGIGLTLLLSSGITIISVLKDVL